MHVHLPKPLHGWREFLGEVDVIVIGVLIALAADQIAELISWRKHIAEAKEDLRGELEQDLYNAEQRVRMEGCIDRRLDQLEQIIERPPARPWGHVCCWQHHASASVVDVRLGQRGRRGHDHAYGC